MFYQAFGVFNMFVYVCNMFVYVCNMFVTCL